MKRSPPVYPTNKNSGGCAESAVKPTHPDTWLGSNPLPGVLRRDELVAAIRGVKDGYAVLSLGAATPIVASARGASEASRAGGSASEASTGGASEAEQEVRAKRAGGASSGTSETSSRVSEASRSVCLSVCLCVCVCCTSLCMYPFIV